MDRRRQNEEFNYFELRVTGYGGGVSWDGEDVCGVFGDWISRTRKFGRGRKDAARAHRSEQVRRTHDENDGNDRFIDADIDGATHVF